jgi:4-alpha-glucanotransferase
VTTATDFGTGRHGGLLLPLFSIPGRRSWGIGEIGDLPVVAAWLERAGLDFVQVLPLNEMAPGQHSPYSAVSAMAIDPIFISLRHVPEFRAAGGEDGMSADARLQLGEVRRAPQIDYNAVRGLKLQALRAAFDLFLEREWRPATPRADWLRRYLEDEGWWVDDYVLYRALREHNRLLPWWEWTAPLARRDPRALDRARQAIERDCLFFAYAQWLADTQWREARAAAAPAGVFGDLPFMVGADSADVWANQHAFRLDATVGAPPDAFSETGQDWGLPVYRWDVFAAEDDRWVRARARRNAALFDGYRVDHLVGYYRTYQIPLEAGKRSFSPPHEDDQRAQGERVMRAFLESGARIIAEDLGTVPEFIRESLQELRLPGYKVLRWEREWDEPASPFRDPQQYPADSVATTGTHDTETLVEWWDGALEEERTALADLPFLRERRIDVASAGCPPSVRDALLELLVASSSDFVILPMQDIFGWRDRINVPATVTDDNWTWRLPWPSDDLLQHPEAGQRAKALRAWMRHHDRSRDLLLEQDEAEAG